MSSSGGGWDLDRLSGAELLDVLREKERVKLAADRVELAVITRLEARNTAFEFGAKNTVDLLRYSLNIGARDAAGRVRLAAAVTDRTTVTGVAVGAVHPQTAAALADGSIGTRAAGTVVKTVEAISDFVAMRRGRCSRRT